MIGWFGSTTQVCWRVKLAMAADILKNDIIACSNWRIKNVSSKYLKKSFKILFFVVSHARAVFPPLTPDNFVGWGVGKRLHVSVWCLATPYTLCFVNFLLMCVLCKMSKSLCASASKCNCEHVGLLMDSSLHSKATGLLHSRQQFLVKFLVRLIERDVYPIKTRDRNAQLVASNLSLWR